MKKKSVFTKGLMILAGVFVTLATLLTSIDVATFDKAFYKKQYQALGTAERIGVSEEDLMRATDVLLDYCAGKRDDLSLIVERDGVRMQMFTDETEVAHMVDVQALFLLMFAVRNGLVIGAAFCIVVAFLLRISTTDAMKMLMIGLGIGLLIPIVCGALAALDFTWFWTQFHHVFFTNDLWLLNPRTSVLIQMVPEEFFSAIVLKILIWFAVAMVVWFSLAGLVRHVVKRRRERKGQENAAVVGH